MQSELEIGSMRYTDHKVDNAPYCIVSTGIISESTSDGYTIKLGNDIEYKNVGTVSATSHSVNDTVKVCIPNNNYSNMFILGKLKLV